MRESKFVFVFCVLDHAPLTKSQDGGELALKHTSIMLHQNYVGSNMSDYRQQQVLKQNMTHFSVEQLFWVQKVNLRQMSQNASKLKS